MRFFHIFHRSKNRGSSLVELSVVVMITIILSSIVFVGLGGTSRNYTALYVEQAKIAELILRAKSLAISTFNIPPVPCGYGIAINYPSLTYSLILYDMPPDDIRCTGIKNRELDLTAVRVFEKGGTPETYALNDKVTLGRGSQHLAYVLFVPPDPTTYVYLAIARRVLPGDTPVTSLKPINSGSGKVYLQSRSGNSSLKIAVSVSGQVTFPP